MHKRTLLKLFALGSAAAGLAAFSPLSAATGSKPLLVAGMDAAYPPFGSRDSATGQYVGFDVDVIRAIGKAEGFNVEVRNIAFDGLIPALKTGNIDITTIRTAKDLEGKLLAVSIGSTGEEAARKIPNARVRVFNQLNECFLELRNKGVDAVINDIPTNDYYAAVAGKGRVLSLPVALTEENLGIAVKKGNTELLKRINSGLSAIKASGEFSKIYQKWFGKEPPAALLSR